MTTKQQRIEDMAKAYTDCNLLSVRAGIEAAYTASGVEELERENERLYDHINVMRMKLERRFQVSDYLADGHREDPPARTIVGDICQDIMAHVREIHSIAEKGLALRAKQALGETV